jgi:tetratricopeptide (TPR) repeat protein
LDFARLRTLKLARSRACAFGSACGRHAPLALAALAAVACATPLEKGERAYHRGEREEAIDAWRGIDAAEVDYRAAQQRIEAVAEERSQLVQRYLQRGRYFEERGRLAEAVLDYRLALRIEPGDRDTLAHVQELSRKLASARSEGLAQFRRAFAEDDLGAARVHIARLRVLDAFSPEIADGQRQLSEALATRVDAIVARGSDDLERGEVARAEAAFQSVLDLDPQNVTARGHLAYIERTRAERGVTAAPGVPPTNAPAQRRADPTRRQRPREIEIRAEGYFQNALGAEASGDVYQAIRYDRAALDVDGSHAGARSHLAALRRALAPQIPQLLDAGRRHYQSEDLKAALDQWERVLLIDPSNAEAKEHSARAGKLLERLEELHSAPLPAASSKP